MVEEQSCPVEECSTSEIKPTRTMTRFLWMAPFFHDHMKSITLATGAVGIWVAQTVTDTMNQAKEIGSWGVTSILSLVCLVMAGWIYKLEKDKKAMQDKWDAREEAREKKEEERELRQLQVMENFTDAITALQQENQKQTQAFEAFGRNLMERGLNAPVQARTRNQTRT